MTHKCTCGCNPGHATKKECDRNVQTTKDHQSRMTGSFHAMLAKSMLTTKEKSN